MMKAFDVGGLTISPGQLFVIGGPCVLEDDPQVAMRIGAQTRDMCRELGVPYVFKASFDKANRSSSSGFRGPGLKRGLERLQALKDELGVPVLTDVHLPEQCAPAAEVVDMLQIPAFLCRQTDMITAAARTGKPVNIKKGQFLSPWEAENPVKKAREAGAQTVLLTERGTSFGYNNLVSDMRSLPIMRGFDVPVVFDATHSLQLPGAGGDKTTGQREFIPHLARAAVAAGVDGIFVEVHEDPASSPSDAMNMLRLDELAGLLEVLLKIKALVP